MSEATWRSRTLWDVLSAAAASGADLDYVVFPGVRLTYGGVIAEAERLSRALWRIGVRSGDRVALWMPNRPEWVTVHYAIGRLGAIAVPINTRYKTEELGFVLKQSGASVLFLTPQFLHFDFHAMLESVRAGAPELRTCVCVAGDAPQGMLSCAEFAAGDQGEGAPEFGAAIRSVTPQHPVHIQYTSGTTAFPKAVLLTQDQIARNATCIADRMHLGADDRIFSPLPFYHVAGFVAGLITAVVTGGRLVTTETFDAGLALEMMQRERCTALRGVESMAAMELSHPAFTEYDLSSLRTGAIGTTSRAVTQAVYEKMGVRELVNVYGLSETTSAVCMPDAGDPLEWRLGSLGRPLPDMAVRIVHPETGAEQPQGVQGEIQTRGWGVMREYFRQPEQTAAAFTDDGWLHTGDLGYVDQDGNLHLAGRIKDMLRVGGENVSAQEVENFLTGHPSVALVGVVGVPDPRLGEVPAAFVVLKPGTAATPAEILAFCRGRIAGFKVPRFVRVVDVLPMTGSGKIQKHVLRQQAAALLETGGHS